jgi:transposase
MGLGEREYQYEDCGFVIDRDLNAALNLEQLLYVS